MSSNRDSTVTLTAAALALSMSYERTLRLVLRGELAGEQVDGRFWRVSNASLERLKRERAEQSMPAAIA